jgi:VIT1/CCC1 family predicted Fe2+/Mn2+ transporter
MREEVVKSFIAELLKNKSDTATFLSAFVSDIFSQGMGDYVSTKRRELNKKSVEAIYQVDEIEKVVNSITDEELKNFNEQQKEAIELFKNPKKSDIFD